MSPRHLKIRAALVPKNGGATKSQQTLLLICVRLTTCVFCLCVVMSERERSQCASWEVIFSTHCSQIGYSPQKRRRPMFWPPLLRPGLLAWNGREKWETDYEICFSSPLPSKKSRPNCKGKTFFSQLWRKRALSAWEKTSFYNPLQGYILLNAQFILQSSKLLQKNKIFLSKRDSSLFVKLVIYFCSQRIIYI